MTALSATTSPSSVLPVGRCRHCNRPVAKHYVTTDRYVFPAFCSRDCARFDRS